jgi:hypothetical protein
MNRAVTLLAGLSATTAATWLWHGPLGAGDRFAAGVDGRARAMLDKYEMAHVQARMARAPLARQVVLSGPADDFQRREIERLVEAQPGVADATWSPASLAAEPRP